MPAVKLPLRRIVMLSAIACLGVSATALAATYQLTSTMHVPTAIASLRSPQVTPQQIQQGELGDNLIFVDVRSPEEHAEDRIANSVLIPLPDIEADFGLKQLGELANADPEATIVLYCQTGPRSFRAYQRLKQVGLATGRNYVVLRGGLKAWRQQGER